MIILGLETSCDETACAILEEKMGSFSILANIVSSQVKLHSKWGGVVPNLAAREHLKNILPIIEKALKQAKISKDEIDLIAVTNGPGLIPALLIGVETAKTLAYLWKKPLIGIHHIEGHIYANFINELSAISKSQFLISKKIPDTKHQIQNTKIKFPILCLVVSGGHTQLILMKNHLQYEIIGETQDDAVGEAFDKVARILNLGYPGGPAIAAIASQPPLLLKEGQGVVLPRPMINSKDFNFSFSGLKTAVLYLTKKNKKLLKKKGFIQAVSQEFQQAVIDVLILKTLSAAKTYNPKTILLAGGVSANIELRKQLGKAIKKNIPNTKYKIPDTKYSLDNAAMVASAAFFRYKKMENKKILKNNWNNLEAKANLKLKLNE